MRNKRGKIVTRCVTRAENGSNGDKIGEKTGENALELKISNSTKMENSNEKLAELIIY